jgi:hypothetical protein
MKETSNVVFRITSATVTAAQIAERTGLKADEAWKVGDPRGRFANIEKVHGFVLESKEAPHQPFEEHVRSMLKRLAPVAAKIGTLAAEAKIDFEVSLHRKAVPQIRFERDDVRWFGVMGARLSLDIFLLHDAPAPSAKPGGPPKPGDGSSGGSKSGVF